MNILFLTMVRLDNLFGRGIYLDLLNELIAKGHQLYIASPAERRTKVKTHIIKGENYEILKIKTLNLQKTNVIEKGIGQLLMEFQFNKAINKYWKDIKFDLVLYSTPPITFNKVINHLKKRDGAKTYLMLKDIFPRNAVDLGMMKEGSLLYKLFRKKEVRLYEISDRIGTMSPANTAYLIKNNPKIDKSKIEECPNALKLIETKKPDDKEKAALLEKLKIPSDRIIFIYGGNLGKPQGIDFLLEVLKEHEKETKSHILIIGSGTEYPKIKKWFIENNPHNATLLSFLPKKEYDKLESIADAGLIFLDHRFTIPNYPSRILNCLENSQPVLCATDPNTDIGKIAEEEGYGLWCESNDVERFMTLLRKLSNDENLRKEMGARGRNYLIKNYTIEKPVETILQSVTKE